MSKKRNIKKLTKVVELLNSGEIVPEDLPADKRTEFAEVTQSFTEKETKRRDLKPGEWYSMAASEWHSKYPDDAVYLAGTTANKYGDFCDIGTDKVGFLDCSEIRPNLSVIPCDPPEWFSKTWKKKNEQ